MDLFSQELLIFPGPLVWQQKTLALQDWKQHILYLRGGGQKEN
jgi:hypothetical protein